MAVDQQTAPQPWVLILDDDEAYTRTLGQILRRRGLLAEIAFDGLTALAIAERLRPAVALADVNMPGMSGIEFARLMPGLSPETRVIMMSADIEAVRHANESGFTSSTVLDKPLPTDRLVTFLRSILDSGLPARPV